jgi:uncharacterized protein (TIGR03067 family)
MKNRLARVLHKRLWCVVAAVVAAGWAPIPRPKAPKPDPVKEEMKRLEGSWEVVRHSADGRPWRDGPRVVYAFQGGRARCVVRGEVTATWQASLDPSRRPKVMDLKAADGGVLPCAYSLSGDELTMAHGTRGRQRRPADLAPREGVCVVVLKRVKKKP